MRALITILILGAMLGFSACSSNQVKDCEKQKTEIVSPRVNSYRARYINYLSQDEF